MAPIRLPLDNPVPFTVTLLGFGLMFVDDDEPSQLEKLEKFLWTSQRQCQKALGGSHPWFDENKICTFLNDYSGVCRYDEGDLKIAFACLYEINNYFYIMKVAQSLMEQDLQLR